MLKFKVEMKRKPLLDPEFVPAVLWNKVYRERVHASGRGENFVITLERSDGTISRLDTEVLPHEGENKDLNIKYVERLVKFLLWMKGGYKIILAGNNQIAQSIKSKYSPSGERAFDHDIMGVRIYGKSMEIESREIDEAPQEKEIDIPLGGHLDGCRIGFDLGGSDRKCAAVIDGKVVFSEEVPWDPYFQKDPQYHRNGINHTLQRAAEKLPRVDAIGGSAAGVYVNNQVRVASLFRGISPEDFRDHIVDLFNGLKEEWNNIPFIVVNDGEVTALAAAMSMNDNSILGVSMGTSLATGYVTPKGKITNWLNELAFVPIDYRDDAPMDEWSGDRGCGVQYFSQQAVARLASSAGLDFPEKMPLSERLVAVQKMIAEGDAKARSIYETIGTYFAYAVAHYAEFYTIKNLLILGRVTSGKGGDIILEVAEKVLQEEFPELSSSIRFKIPDEQDKRHGQAVAAASLPEIKK